MKLQLPFIFVLILAGLYFTSCKKDPGVPIPTFSNCGNNPIRFSTLEVGQTSCYIGLAGEDYHSSNGENFYYSDDTLQLAITAQDGNRYLVAESFHYAGDVFDWLRPDKDTVYHYYLQVSNDTLRFKPTGSGLFFSRIFSYQILMQGLPLGKFTNQSVDIKGWKTSIPYCECRNTGYTVNYTLFGQDYPYLNVLVENSAMSFDGNGESYVYSAEYGLIRASTYSWWTSDGIGWDLLP